MRIKLAAVMMLALGMFAAMASAQAQPLFKKIQLTDKFYAEGADFGDFNHDGKIDVVYGPYWYEGPDFKTAHEIYEPKAYDPKGYSNNFLTFVADFNGDGWDDILQVGFPSKEAWIYENPKGKEGRWTRRLACQCVDNESPVLADIDGDGKPELLCCNGGKIGYYKADPKDANAPWIFHPITPKGKWHKYSHGIGYGDINGDGKVDIIDPAGWWEQPQSLDGDPVWKLHEFKFCAGGAQMLVTDVDGDGKNDVITCENPHNYGLQWWQQTRDDKGNISFTRHVITGAKPEESPYGVKFSQPHALVLADIDGSGMPGFITGKRHWAHGPKGDVEPEAPSVLYWFRAVRGPSGAQFVPYLIDDTSGVGTQVAVGAIKGEKFPCVVSSNKNGASVFVNLIGTLGKDAVEKAAPAKK